MRRTRRRGLTYEMKRKRKARTMGTVEHNWKGVRRDIRRRKFIGKEKGTNHKHCLQAKGVIGNNVVTHIHRAIYSIAIEINRECVKHIVYS